jgi:Putative MetA-pathway of phenol degradation
VGFDCAIARAWRAILVRSENSLQNQYEQGHQSANHSFCTSVGRARRKNRSIQHVHRYSEGARSRWPNSWSLDSEIGIFRAIHFASLFGFTIDPQILIPNGRLNNVQIGSQPQNSSSGLGDPIVGTSLLLINRPETSTYFAISPLVTLPLGQYRRSDAINLSNDRYQGDLQLGVHTAFGSEGVAKQVVVALFADANFFSANTHSAIQSNSGRKQATLTKSTSYQLQSWLTYTTNGGVTVSAGYSATMGGRESLGGLPSGFRTEERQARFEVQKFVAKDWQLAAELTHDVHVVGEFRQQIGVNGRILFVF